MQRKKIIKKGLCALSVAALLVTSIQLPARAETINLNMTDVNENQDIFSKTYLYDGEYKTIYIYNNDDGTAKMTGDILVSNGFGKTQCRHIDGYINIPFEVKDFEITENVSRNPFSTLNVEYEMLFIDTNNGVYTFNQPILSQTYPTEGYYSEQEYKYLNGGESVEGIFVQNGDSYWTYRENIYDSGVSGSGITKMWMLDHTSQYMAFEKTYGAANSAEVFTRISENSIKVHPVTITNACFSKEGTVTNFRDITPTVNGTVSTYTDFSGLVIEYDSTDSSMTITATSGSVDYDIANGKFVTDYGDILVTAKTDYENIYPSADILTDKEDFEEVEDGTTTTPGHYNSTPVWFWVSSLNMSSDFVCTSNGTEVGYTFTCHSDAVSIFIDFETSKVSVYVNGNVTEYDNLIQTDGTAKTFTTNNILSLAEMPSMISSYMDEIKLEYEDEVITTTFDAHYNIKLSGFGERAGYKGVLDELDKGSNMLVSASNGAVNVTGFKETGMALPYDSMINSILLKDVAYSYDCEDGTYVLKNNKELYKVLPTKVSAKAIYLDAIKVADNVVKCSEKHYLTVDGKMYTLDGTLVLNGVTNITDGTYTVNGTVYRLDGTEFLKNYATDYNVTINTVNKNTYEVSYGEDIVSVVAPDGTHLNDGDTYICLLEGAYLFTVTNAYGDTFTKTLLVSGLDTGLELPAINVLNNVVTLYSDYTIEISDDLNSWTDYTGPIEYEDAFYYRVVTEDKTSDVIKMEIVDGKVQSSNISETYLSANNFCGYGYIDDSGTLFDLNGNFVANDVISAAYFDTTQSGKTTISIYGDIYHNSELFKSKKALKETGIGDAYKVFMDGVYTYIVSSQGEVVRTRLGETILGASNLVYAVDWDYEWLGSNYQGISADGTITYGDGQTVNVAYNEELGIPFSDLKLYTRADIDSYAVGTDLTNVPVSSDKIIAVRVVNNGYTALADNGRVYIYDSALGAMVYDDIILYGSAYQTDVTQSTSSWTNSAVDLVINESINSISYNDISFYNRLMSEENNMGVHYEWIMESWYLVKLTITEPSILSFGTESDTSWDEKYGNLAVLDEDDNYIDADTIIDENGQAIAYAPYEGYATYYYSLDAGTYYLEFWDEFLDFSSTYTLNGETYYFADLYKDAIIENAENPYVIEDATGNAVQMSTSDKGYFATVGNGKYIIKTIIDGEVVTTNTVVVNNVDTIKPSITPVISNNTLTFSARDNEGGNSAVSGIDRIFYSTDNVTFVEIEEGAQIKYSLGRSTEANTIIVNTKNVYMYTIDKAGNASETYTFDLSSDDIGDDIPDVDEPDDNKPDEPDLPDDNIPDEPVDKPSNEPVDPNTGFDDKTASLIVVLILAPSPALVTYLIHKLLSEEEYEE